jgi:hypothetical protein
MRRYKTQDLKVNDGLEQMREIYKPAWILSRYM